MADGDWKEALPEAMRANPTIQDVKAANATEALAALAQRLVDTKALVGQSIRIPGQDAGPEARKELLARLREKVPELVYAPPDAELAGEVEKDFWKRLGKPEKPEDYKLEGIELEAGVQVDEKTARGLAEKLGLTKSQFKTLVKDVMGQEQLQQLASLKEEGASLKKDWGAAYEERLVAAKAVAVKMGVPEAALPHLTPGELRVWANVAKSFAQTPQVAGQSGGAPAGKPDPTEARAQMAEIITRMTQGDWQPHRNPAGHALGQQKILELMELIPE